ncbi:hypothetical protein OF83DRAFT_1112476 [Amylostereum chailletii]|nr:hypothetical protein OF83DRAFT_1112476 [Amylostereum chailletii]
MSALDDNPADAVSVDTQHLQPQQPGLQQDPQSQQALSVDGSSRKPKAPAVRRACTACHSGKTRCSEVLPCQSCLKRGLGATCAYPDPDAMDHTQQQTPGVSSMMTFIPMHTPETPSTISHQQYYQYDGTYTGASTSTFRPQKRPRPLTEEETAAIRNFSRGDFYVGSSAPVRIDPRLPVRLTLGEGDHVHFTIGESLL